MTRCVHLCTRSWEIFKHLFFSLGWGYSVTLLSISFDQLLNLIYKELKNSGTRKLATVLWRMPAQMKRVSLIWLFFKVYNNTVSIPRALFMYGRPNLPNNLGLPTSFHRLFRICLSPLYIPFVKWQMPWKSVCSILVIQKAESLTKEPKGILSKWFQ